MTNNNDELENKPIDHALVLWAARYNQNKATIADAIRFIDHYAEHRARDAVEEMREDMYAYYHVHPATMNDKQAIADFDYEFEERIKELKVKQN